MTASKHDIMTINRRALLQGVAGFAAGTALLGEPAVAADGGKKVIIGAFADGGLTPFKEKIIPLAKQAGFNIEFLEDEYGVTLEKWFADAQNGGGQYDVYLLDDPWVPQFGAADVLEDLAAGGIDGGNKDWVNALIDMGYWPPRQGPRVKGFEKATPKLICVPFIGDLQTMTYRTDVYKTPPKTWEELISVGQQGVKDGKIKYPVVFRGVAGNSIMNSWFPLFRSWGGVFFDERWQPTFNSKEGKESAEFFVGTMKKNAPEGIVEYDSDQEGAAILSGDVGAIVQYSGNAVKANDPAQSKVPDKLAFSVIPKKKDAIAQLGIFIAGVPKKAPNKANAVAFLKWYTSPEVQMKVAESGSIPVTRSGFAAPKPGNNLIAVALQQLDVGAEPRPRMPDWAKVEEIIGIELNKALQKGSGGGEALDTAAASVKSFLQQAGYY